MVQASKVGVGRMLQGSDTGVCRWMYAKSYKCCRISWVPSGIKSPPVYEKHPNESPTCSLLNIMAPCWVMSHSLIIMERDYRESCRSWRSKTMHLEEPGLAIEAFPQNGTSTHANQEDALRAAPVRMQQALCEFLRANPRKSCPTSLSPNPQALWKSKPKSLIAELCRTTCVRQVLDDTLTISLLVLEIISP